MIAGAVRVARPGSPWARWRYRARPGRLATAVRREERLRLPLIRTKNRIQDVLTGSHGQPLIWPGRYQPAEPEPETEPEPKPEPEPEPRPRDQSGPGESVDG